MGIFTMVNTMLPIEGRLEAWGELGRGIILHLRDCKRGMWRLRGGPLNEGGSSRSSRVCVGSVL